MVLSAKVRGAARAALSHAQRPEDVPGPKVLAVALQKQGLSVTAAQVSGFVSQARARLRVKSTMGSDPQIIVPEEPAPKGQLSELPLPPPGSTQGSERIQPFGTDVAQAFAQIEHRLMSLGSELGLALQKAQEAGRIGAEAAIQQYMAKLSDAEGSNPLVQAKVLETPDTLVPLPGLRLHPRTLLYFDVSRAKGFKGSLAAFLDETVHAYFKTARQQIMIVGDIPS